jgi:rSAM/selenodomain-associated transferase 1
LVLFAKPAEPGRVKTRLIGDLTAAEAAELYEAFVGDLVDRLVTGSYDLRLAWSLEAGEELPDTPVAAMRQEGGDLGERMYRALQRVAEEFDLVGVVGSDHPTLELERIHQAYRLLEGWAEVVIGPTEDGGYYLLAVRSEALTEQLFQDIAWSTREVLPATLERCRELNLEVALLEPAWDVDTPEDLRRLSAHLTADGHCCPRTRRLLASWRRLPLSELQR